MNAEGAARRTESIGRSYFGLGKVVIRQRVHSEALFDNLNLHVNPTLLLSRLNSPVGSGISCSSTSSVLPLTLFRTDQSSSVREDFHQVLVWE